jgi:hypothetical protein
LASLAKGLLEEVDKELQSAQQAYEQVLQGENANGQCPTHLEISHTCEDDMPQIIHPYSAVNAIRLLNIYNNKRDVAEIVIELLF